MSLTLSGALMWALVRQLEFDNANDELARSALQLRVQLAALDCLSRDPAPPHRCLPGMVVRNQSEFVANVSRNLDTLDLGGDRLVLLDKHAPPRIMFDTDGALAIGQQIPLGRQIKVIAGQPVSVGTVRLGVEPFLVAATRTPSNKIAGWLVLARPSRVVGAQATTELAPRILESAGAGLLLAVVVTLLLSRAFSGPLRELKVAAEDIAHGNYSRRVRLGGGDEMGFLGQAFNRMAEAVERSRAQQRAFLANVSHELKTPLTSLIGFSQALMDGSLRTDEERMRAATILHEEAQRVLRMSQELLDLARVESGQLALNLHAVDLGVQVRQEIEMIGPRAQARGLTLRLAMAAALPPVEADPDRLHQILENLLDNAVKYAPADTDVWISAQQEPGGRISTAVRNRVGARPPDPERMFDRFYRSDPSRSSAAGGVGLGLAISRELAIAQHGALTAELSHDGSLCLRLDLPAATQPPAPVQLPGRQPSRLAPHPAPRPAPRPVRGT